jgi:hypothetical protein
LHEKHAFITIWDDHEFANDGYRSFAPDSADSPRRADAARRSAANRAWAEFTPAGVPYNAEKGPTEEIKIYRSPASVAGIDFADAVPAARASIITDSAAVLLQFLIASCSLLGYRTAFTLSSSVYIFFLLLSMWPFQ